MSDLLSIGASGVRAYQIALGTVGDNIANSGVAGYTRRTVDLREVGATSAGLNARTQLDGNGVLAFGIKRQADMFRAKAVRTSSADLARTEAGTTWLSRIEGALTDNRLSERLTDVFTSARRLAADATSLPSRAVLLEAADGAASAFARTGTALARAAAELDATGEQAVAGLNSLGTALAKINDGLARTQPGSSQAAQLADQRDQLLSDMSAIADVSVRTDSIGRAEVRLGGATGPLFVAGVETGRVSMRRNEEGAVAFAVQRAGETWALSPSSGALAGMAESAGRIAAATESLGMLAAGFVTDVNAVQAGGVDLDGQPGKPLFAAGDPATAITRVMTDPRGIAAARVGGGSTDPSNLQALEAARLRGGWEAGVTTLVTANAAALEQRRLVADAQGAIRDNAVAAQQSASGVDLDTEAVELLRFQQAYQASSRVIQTARDIMQTILEIR